MRISRNSWPCFFFEWTPKVLRLSPSWTSCVCLCFVLLLGQHKQLHRSSFWIAAMVYRLMIAELESGRRNWSLDWFWGPWFWSEIILRWMSTRRRSTSLFDECQTWLSFEEFWIDWDGGDAYLPGRVIIPGFFWTVTMSQSFYWVRLFALAE